MASVCEFEFMEYLGEDAIDSNLICSICHRPLVDPVCTPCDHTFGRACITEWLAQSDHCSCPMCLHNPLSTRDFTPANRLFRNMLDQLRVRCTLCEETGLQRGNFLDHISKVCPKATVQCQAADIKCPWKGQRDELHNHASVCIFEPLRPVLATLVAENQRLVDQIRGHDNKIKELTQKMSQLSNTAAADSDDENDAPFTSEVPVDGSYYKEEDSIIVRNLPPTVKFLEVLSIFAAIGSIKLIPNTQRRELFIFNDPTKQNGLRMAKITYINKELAAAAIARLNNQYIPSLNTTLDVHQSYRKKTTAGVAEPDIGNYTPQQAAATGSSLLPTNESQTPFNNNKNPRRPHPPPYKRK